MTIDDVESYGAVKFLSEIAETLKNGEYRPFPTKRVYIPKGDGKERPLGLLTIRDKMVQTATKLVIEPIFEADFKDNSYGFRPKRSQHVALEAGVMVNNVYESSNEGSPQGGVISPFYQIFI